MYSKAVSHTALLKGIIFLAAFLSLTIIIIMPARAAANLVIVGPDGYSQLQDAITDVNEGGTILMRAGQYSVPHLSINRSITICSSEGAVLLPAADTATSGDTASWIRVESGCQVEFNGLTLNGSGKKIYNALYGAGTLSVRNCTFTGIQYAPNKGRAIVLTVDNPLVEGCTFSHIGRSGIYVYASRNALLTNNYYTGKGMGNWLDYGIEIAGGAQAVLQANTITACTGHVSPAYSAAILISSDNIAAPTTVSIEGRNTISNNLYGIQIGTLANDCSQVQITNNIITENDSSSVFSTSTAITAENNYWGLTGPGIKGANAVPNWLDTCPWAVDMADVNGDGLFDQLAYPLELQWPGGVTDLQITGLEPGAICRLSFTAYLNESAQKTNVTYILEWTAADPNTLTGITVNGISLQDNIATIADTLQPGQQTTYQINAEITTPGTYTIFLYAVATI